MIKIVVFLLLTIINVIIFLTLIINGGRWVIRAFRHLDRARIAHMIRRNSVIFIGTILLLILFVFFTQVTVSTPSIKDDNGKVVEGSIAELRKVTLNGHDEWISIRGVNRNAPILLFLSGGPGGTQMATTRCEFTELEKHFVIVNWDQPGSGKSYNCIKRSDITVNTYIDDGVSLTAYLKEQFHQDKIYLLGESWGSALGIFLANQKPEYYAGFIGTGQMVDFKQTEIEDYHKAIEIAKGKNDKDTVKKIENQGEPPYYDGNISLKSATYLNYLSSYMTNDSNITNGGYHTLRDMFSSEFGILDSAHYLLGLMNTFNVVYPQLYETDLRKEYTKLDVPVYIFLGRHDVNAPTSLAEEYYNLLDVPKKELVWFAHSGHSPWLNETELFTNETIRVFEK